MEQIIFAERDLDRDTLPNKRDSRSCADVYRRRRRRRGVVEQGQAILTATRKSLVISLVYANLHAPCIEFFRYISIHHHVFVVAHDPPEIDILHSQPWTR